MRYAPLLLLAGCSMVHFSVMGPDTYAVETGQTFVGRQEAQRFCSERGKYVLITNSQQRFDGATTIFRCLNADDPEYQRPTYRKPPAAVIEDGRK